MSFLLGFPMFRFHVNLPGCNGNHSLQLKGFCWFALSLSPASTSSGSTFPSWKVSETAPLRNKTTDLEPDGHLFINCLVVEPTPLKNISQNGNLPQVGVKIENISNHPLVNGCCNWMMNWWTKSFHKKVVVSTKHPFKTGCIGYQESIYNYPALLGVPAVRLFGVLYKFDVSLHKKQV